MRNCTNVAIRAAVEEEAEQAISVLVGEDSLCDLVVVRYVEVVVVVELVVGVQIGGRVWTEVGGSVQWYEVRTRLGQSMCSQRLGVKQI